jgi:hypothetical protein
MVEDEIEDWGQIVSFRPGIRRGLGHVVSDPEFARRDHRIEEFRRLISPLFMNAYLAERIGPARGAVHA